MILRVDSLKNSENSRSSTNGLQTFNLNFNYILWCSTKNSVVFDSTIICFTFKWTAENSTGHPGQSSAESLSRDYRPRASLRLRTALDWLEWVVAPAMVRRKVKRTIVGTKPPFVENSLFTVKYRACTHITITTQPIHLKHLVYCEQWTYQTPSKLRIEPS